MNTGKAQAGGEELSLSPPRRNDQTQPHPHGRRHQPPSSGQQLASLLNIEPAQQRPLRATLLSFLLALPWCCILPALLSVFSFATAFTATLFSPRLLLPTFLISIAALLYAHYRIWIRKHGSKTSRLLTTLLTPLILALWYFRLFL